MSSLRGARNSSYQNMKRVIEQDQYPKNATKQNVDLNHVAKKLASRADGIKCDQCQYTKGEHTQLETESG